MPLDAAFAALFTADERVDYARDDFRGDVAAFRGDGGGAPLGADEALAFLEYAM